MSRGRKEGGNDGRGGEEGEARQRSQARDAEWVGGRGWWEVDDAGERERQEGRGGRKRWEGERGPGEKGAGGSEEEGERDILGKRKVFISEISFFQVCPT